MKILLLEPDRLIAETYKTALENEGHEVMVARGAQQAITIADKVTPDVVIAEIQIARHNGIEFLYEFKSYTEWVDVPIIIMTNLPPRLFDMPTLSTLGVVSILMKQHTSLAMLCEEISKCMSSGKGACRELS